jgi:hypothetical protein
MTFTYFDGKLDCQNGVEHVEGKGKAYDLGYGEQYQREQIADNGFFGKLMRETEKREAVANEIK